MTSKIGINFHARMSYGRELSADEKRKLFEFLEALQPSSCLVLDNYDYAIQFKKLLPSSMIVFRQWRRNDGALHRDFSGADYARQIERYGQHGICVSIMNEPTGYGEQNREDDLERIAGFFADASAYLSKQGVYHCGVEFGVGHPDLNRLSELNDYYDALTESKGYGIASVHEYGTWRGMTYQGEPHRFDVYPYRVGRYKAQASYIISRYGRMPFRWLFNEWGVDASLYVGDDNKRRGWKDSFSPEQYVNALIAADVSFYTEDWIIGKNIFSYGNTGQKDTGEDWFTHDISGQPIILNALIEHGKRIHPIPVPQPPDIKKRDLQSVITIIRNNW